MEQAPLPFDHDHLVVLVGQHELLGGAVEEVGDHPVHGTAVALDHDARLPGGHELGVHAPPLQPLGHLDGGDHLAATAIVGDRLDPQAPLADALAVGHVVLVAFAHVDQLDAVLPRPPATKLRIVVRESRAARRRRSASPGDRLQDDRPPGLGDLAAGRGDADQQRVGLRARRPASRPPGSSPPRPNTSWHVLPAPSRSSTATTSSGR